MTRHTPPRPPEHVLRWAIGRREVAEGIVGDLVEEFHARSREQGPRPAARWFWVQSLAIATAFRVRGRSVRNGGRPRGSVLAELRDETWGAARSLGRAPGFTALAIGILAVGVGSATAVFDSFDSVVATALPVTDPGRLVTLTLHRRDGAPVGLVPREIAEVAGGSRSLRDVAGTLDRTGTMPVTEGERPLVLNFAFVTSGFFDVLGARPALGRLFHPSDASEGAPAVAVISHATWRREFGGSVDVLGRHLVATQYQGSYRIVGVAPAGLDYPVGTDYWILPGRRAQTMGLVARLDAAATVDATRAEFLALARSVVERRPGGERPTTATITGFTDAVVGEARPLLLAMAGAAGLLLLVAMMVVPEKENWRHVFDLTRFNQRPVKLDPSTYRLRVQQALFTKIRVHHDLTRDQMASKPPSDIQSMIGDPRLVELAYSKSKTYSPQELRKLMQAIRRWGKSN